MTLTSIGRSPFLLIAIIRECLADTMRGIAWLIKLTQLPKLEMQDEAPLGFWRCTHATEKFSPSFIPGGVYQTMPMETGSTDKIGRAHVCTSVTNAQLVCRLLLEKNKTTIRIFTYHYT